LPLIPVVDPFDQPRGAPGSSRFSPRATKEIEDVR
jgi:hypothetical protein